VRNIEDKIYERNVGTALGTHAIRLPNLGSKPMPRLNKPVYGQILTQTQNVGDGLDPTPPLENDDGSVEKLPSTKSRVKTSRNSKMHKSRSTCVANILSKTEEGAGHDDEENGTNMPPPKRKIKIIQNSKNSKVTKIKNSHMVILKSIQQKLNIKGLMKENE
jgi:hypothetical protein